MTRRPLNAWPVNSYDPETSTRWDGASLIEKTMNDHREVIRVQYRVSWEVTDTQIRKEIITAITWRGDINDDATVHRVDATRPGIDTNRVRPHSKLVHCLLCHDIELDSRFLPVLL